MDGILLPLFSTEWGSTGRWTSREIGHSLFGLICMRRLGRGVDSVNGVLVSDDFCSATISFGRGAETVDFFLGCTGAGRIQPDMDRGDLAVFHLYLDSLRTFGGLVHEPDLESVVPRWRGQPQDGSFHRIKLGEDGLHLAARFSGTLDFPTQAKVGVGVEVHIACIGVSGGGVYVRGSATSL